MSVVWIDSGILLENIYNIDMAKRKNANTTPKTSRSKKTKKRLVIKYARLAEKKKNKR